jgi:hypothetical protein
MMSRGFILLLMMKHYRRGRMLHRPEGNHPPEMWIDDILITAGDLLIRVLPDVVHFEATCFLDNILYDVACIDPTRNEIDDL